MVYDQNGTMAAALLSCLQWAGAANVSYLSGGIEGWHLAGFHTSTEPHTREARTFGGTLRPELVVSSAELSELLKNENVVLIDARAIDRARGTTQT